MSSAPRIAIAGAGPAGVATAVALVRQDPSLVGRVVLFDRARFPRDKPCGGGLTGRALEALSQLGLELSVPVSAAPRAKVAFGSTTREVALERPIKVVRREEFDASLVEQAKALGIEVRQATPIERFCALPDGVEIEAGGRRERVAVLVGADGAGSQVRKHLIGRSTERQPIRLFRLELSAESAAPRWPADTMLYDFTPMAEGLRGYLWIFPAPGGRLNVGLMHAPTRAYSGAALDALLWKHLARFGIARPQAARGWPAWGYSPESPIASERLLLVGDAAGIDALTGEGIAVGLESGWVAARAIVDALSRSDFSFRGYRRALRRATVGRELAVDRWLAWLLYREEGWRDWLPLILEDERLLELYAARVCGALILADQKPALLGALVRHLVLLRGRRRRIMRAKE